MSVNPFRWLLLAILSSLSPALMAASADSVDCATEPLQGAIDAAEPGSVLTLQGLCEGHFTIDKDLTLKGASAQLVGIDDGPVLTLKNGATAPRVQLMDLTVRDGGASLYFTEDPFSAGGVLILNEVADPLVVLMDRITLTDNTVPANEEATGAGGIATRGPVYLTIRDSVVSNNGVRNASLDRTIVGGILLGPQGRLVMFDTELLGNFNLTDGGGSGGLDCAGHCVMVGGQITDNQTGSDSTNSGAGFTVRQDGFLLMKGVGVQDNRSDWDTLVAGGGVVMGHAVLSDTQVRDNHLVPTGDSDGAAGLLVHGGVLEMVDSTVQGNRAPGIYHRGAAGLTASDRARVTLTRTAFRDNQAALTPSGTNAGAIMLSDDSRLSGSDVTVRQNGGQVGGIRVGEGTRLVLDGSRVQGNLGDQAGGIWRDSTASTPGEILLLDTRVFNNTPNDCSGFTSPACP
ncbi:hypothetical protein [Ferrimonas balearica]|uniref:hypothetical protein n=1 Tax=Ferrimonas balearica TaxID=44012 RepID=UPI001C99A08D|nr:hypothetical protein [Ferrimonas balearica]MBY5992392.1 hypothetical protein [Ferrimonas balearica]